MSDITEDKFTKLTKYAQLFGFLTKCKTIPKQITKDSAIQLQNVLKNSKLRKDNNGDIIADKKTGISGAMLCEELEPLSLLPYEFQYPLNPKKFLNSRHTSFPNVFIVVQIV